MDPGTAVGAISLVFQIFAVCVQGCQVILELKYFPQEYDYLRHCFYLEQLKLLDWWTASGFTYETTIEVAQQDERRRAALESLNQIKALMLEASEIKQRHGPSSKSAEDNKGESAGGVFSKLPTRLRWVVSDADRFERLLARFIALNKSLDFILKPDQRSQFLQFQEITQLEFVRLHDKVDQILEFERSRHRLPSGHGSGGSSQGSNENSYRLLERLTRFKALNMSVIDDGVSYENDAAAQPLLRVPLSDDLKLSLSAVKLQDNQKEDKSQRVSGTFNDAAVWIEWKCYDEDISEFYCRFIENRIERLATLLLKNPENPEKLHLPAALGYVHDPSSARFGLVFESPTLTSISIIPKPSLTIRIDMALRLTTSFDYSRPSDDRTELPTKQVQFDVPRDGKYGYEEKHDVYSLGVVLMEIGLWRPIHLSLGLSLNEHTQRPVIRGVQDELLKATRLASLESEVVKLCLVGNTKPSPNGSQSLGNIRENGYSSGDSMDCLQKAKEALQSIIV
ncbi:prion-inhibition and propagation-domain-containing protein [Daldinia caldariorum]|uniref:prion-inhibition and propagation-domain-containing protein n=1 Tax=Daldinia caldariorum TaxID=326644 RepID=UPI002008EB3B|nr:prion-inhibition and propagation-domain-containing protein [Daldinia caldariorum]KAI1463536.1 prion-inhibition and propagation-domain-containing protein [Daldinia caldariorum]